MVWVVGIQEKLVGFLTLCWHLLLKREYPEIHDVQSVTTSWLSWAVHLAIISLL